MMKGLVKIIKDVKTERSERPVPLFLLCVGTCGESYMLWSSSKMSASQKPSQILADYYSSLSRFLWFHQTARGERAWKRTQTFLSPGLQFHR
jgi:hypothetical protein